MTPEQRIESIPGAHLAYFPSLFGFWSLMVPVRQPLGGLRPELATMGFSFSRARAVSAAIAYLERVGALQAPPIGGR